MMTTAPRIIDRLEDPWEMMIYRAICDAASDDRDAPTCDDLADLIGSSAVSTTVGIIQRLENKGLIKVRRYQRARQIFVVALGKWTREPAGKAAPWREQAVTLSALSRERPDEAIELQRGADKLGVTLAEHLRSLVWAGASIQQSGS